MVITFKKTLCPRCVIQLLWESPNRSYFTFHDFFLNMYASHRVQSKLSCRGQSHTARAAWISVGEGNKKSSCRHKILKIIFPLNIYSFRLVNFSSSNPNASLCFTSLHLKFFWTEFGATGGMSNFIDFHYYFVFTHIHTQIYAHIRMVVWLAMIFFETSVLCSHLL